MLRKIIFCRVNILLYIYFYYYYFSDAFALNHDFKLQISKKLNENVQFYEFLVARENSTKKTFHSLFNMRNRIPFFNNSKKQKDIRCKELSSFHFFDFLRLNFYFV